MFNNDDRYAMFRLNDDDSMATIVGKLIGAIIGVVLKYVCLAWAIAWGIHLASTL